MDTFYAVTSNDRASNIYLNSVFILMVTPMMERFVAMLQDQVCFFGKNISNRSVSLFENVQKNFFLEQKWATASV